MSKYYCTKHEEKCDEDGLCPSCGGWYRKETE